MKYKTEIDLIGYGEREAGCRASRHNSLDFGCNFILESRCSTRAATALAITICHQC